jgi:hypothetical protein
MSSFETEREQQREQNQPDRGRREEVSRNRVPIVGTSE